MSKEWLGSELKSVEFRFRCHSPAGECLTLRFMRWIFFLCYAVDQNEAIHLNCSSVDVLSGPLLRNSFFNHSFTYYSTHVRYFFKCATVMIIYVTNYLRPDSSELECLCFPVFLIIAVWPWSVFAGMSTPGKIGSCPTFFFSPWHNSLSFTVKRWPSVIMGLKMALHPRLMGCITELLLGIFSTSHPDNTHLCVPGQNPCFHRDRS